MTDEYFDLWRSAQSICGDCEDLFFPHQGSHYVYTVCPDCLEKSPYVPYEGDHRTGKRDSRASLRRDGQEGDE